MSPPRFLLVNVWHDDNKGDSAIASGTIRLLQERWPGCAITVSPLRSGDHAVRHLRAAAPEVSIIAPLTPVMPDARGVKGALPLAAWSVQILWLAALAALRPHRHPLHRALADVDTVILVGGSNLFDTRSGFGLSTLRLLHLVMPALVAARSGRAVWLLGHTLGPFRSRAGERIAAHVVRRADRVVLREATSLDVARRLGATDPVVAGDMALELRPRRSSKVAAVLERAGVVDRHFAVVTVRRAPYGDVADDDRLGIELIRAMRQLLDDGLVEVVVMVAHVLGPTAVEDDRTATRHLFDHARHVLGTDRLRLVEDDLAPDELAALYGAARLVIGERFHSVLLALAAGTPAYAISYFTRKASGMMHDLGLDEFHCELREADGDRIGRGAVALCDPQTRARVDDAVSHARKTIDGALA